MIMALNKSILMKLNEKTKNDEQQHTFLLKIFKYEFSGKKGWYKERYEEILKESMGEEKNED